MRVGETWRLRWADIDLINKTVRVTPEKGSEPRIFKISDALLERLGSIRGTGDRVYGKNLKTKRELFESLMKRVAYKLKNPRILGITFHTFRYWKATTLYHQTKDILYVMNSLGHKNIKNTLIYVRLDEAIYQMA
ncbi:site-specific integrase [Candidatus Bathyarchaeota archaeon]|nr:site-specific integrase [Candidatus Bathyarchaeota archaeon]